MCIRDRGSLVEEKDSIDGFAPYPVMVHVPEVEDSISDSFAPYPVMVVVLEVEDSISSSFAPYRVMDAEDVEAGAGPIFEWVPQEQWSSAGHQTQVSTFLPIALQPPKLAATTGGGAGCAAPPGCKITADI